ncbi:MAG: O-antigen ligase family protein [bacterium]
MNSENKSKISIFEFILFGLLFLSVSSLVLLNKSDLIIYNIYINLTLIIAYVLRVLLKREKIALNNALLSYAIFTLYCFFSILWSVDKDESVALVIREFSIVVTGVLLYNLLLRDNLFKWFYGAVFFASGFNFFVLIFNPQFIDAYEGGERFVGTMTNSNAISIFIVFNIFISILISIDLKDLKKIAFLNINIVLSLLLILKTMSRKGIIAGTLLFFVHLVISTEVKQKVVFAIILLISLSFFHNSFSNVFQEIDDVSDILFERFEGASSIEGKTTDASTELRLYYIESGLKMIADKPVFGWGVNTFLIFHNGYYSHNNYIEIMSGTGIVGLLLYYLFFFFTINSALKNLKGKRLFLFLFFLIFFMVMDVAIVSYYERIYMMFLFFISAYIDKEKQNV